MAVSLFALLRRIRSALFRPVAKHDLPVQPTKQPAQTRPIAIQSLEGRRMLSGGHNSLVVNEQLIGPESAITSVVLTVNQHLDSATADNPNSYAIVRKITQTNNDNGGIGGSLNPFGSGSSSSQSIIARHVKIASAVYNDSDLTVTLTPAAPFRADKFFRFVRVVGTGKNAIFTAAGHPVDAAGSGKASDAIIKFSSHVGSKLVYNDSYRNHVTLSLSGPGKIRALYRRVGTMDPIVFVIDAVPGETVLSGAVKKGHHGSGVTTLQELSGTSQFINELASNPDFNIELTQP